jgi:hypothetical protein
MPIEVAESLPTAVNLNQPTDHQDPFTELNAVLKKWFYKPDLQAVRIVLGAIKAHYLKIGDPAWLFLVAPPASGKSTMSLMGASGLPEVQTLSDFTENTFLSGFYGHKEPGLLEKLGTTAKNGNISVSQGNAVFLAKDFTTVLSMRRDKRGTILSQLREIHDGSFRRDFGTGETKIWQGRVTILAAVTPVLDRYYSVFSVLGERFLQIRWHRPDSEEAGEWAIEQQGQEDQIKVEAREAIKNTFAKATLLAPSLPTEMTPRIAALSEIVAIGRTHIFRNAYGSREIEYAPEPEANTRLAKGLAALIRGIAALNGHKGVEEQDLQDGFRVGLDCLPENRRHILLAASRGQDLASISIAPTMRFRAAEELEALGILEDKRQPKLSDRAALLLIKAGF